MVLKLKKLRSANRSAEERQSGFVMRNKEILHIPNTQEYKGLSSSELEGKRRSNQGFGFPYLTNLHVFGSVGAASDENAFDQDFIDFLQTRHHLRHSLPTSNA